MITDELVFRALADSTRRQILLLLRQREYAVGEIAERFPMSRPAISKHLRLLREAGLTRERRHGRERLYGLEIEALGVVEEWLREVREGGEVPEPVAKTARRSKRGKRAEAVPRPRATPRPRPSLEPEPEPETEQDDWRAW